VVMLVVAIAALIGYVKNIVELVQCVDEPIAAEVVVRGIGVFVFPLGAVAGYVSTEE